jgi:hypothetical protein
MKEIDLLQDIFRDTEYINIQRDIQQKDHFILMFPMDTNIEEYEGTLNEFGFYIKTTKLQTYKANTLDGYKTELWIYIKKGK